MLVRWALILILAVGCAHRIEVDSTPTEAKVWGLNSSGARVKVVGHTPLRLARLEEGMNGIEIESNGHLPQRFMIPFAGGQDFRLKLNLQKLDSAWIQSLPPETLRGAVDSLSGELFAFQSEIFASSGEEAEKLIEERGKRLDPLGVFHEIIGNYWFYNNRYLDAAKEYSRVLELDPKNEEARKMLVLTDVKSVNKTMISRSKAFTELRAAAGDIAQQASGYVVKTRSQANLVEPDGFDIVLPSDLLFRPTTARFTKIALEHLRKLAADFSTLQQGLGITIEGHTDSDMSAELENAPGLVVGGQSPFKSLWELSSGRAAAVMEFLRNENVAAEKWNIAGYADTRPIKVGDSKDKAKPSAEPSLNRRIVIKVQLLGEDKKETIITQEEAKRIKQRLAEFMVQDDENVPARRRPSRESEPAMAPKQRMVPLPRVIKKEEGAKTAPKGKVRVDETTPSQAAPKSVAPAAKYTPAPESLPTSARPRMPKLSLPGG